MNDISFPYVVLRNWDNLPDSVELGVHSDLDLLVYDWEHFFEVFPMITEEYGLPRVRCKLEMEVGTIYMDVRHVGDGYYPKDFQKAILQTREFHENGFYTPNAIHHAVALAYHVVHHKNMNVYQRYLGDASVEDLLDALKQNTVGWVPPKDPTVGSFNRYWRGCTSIVAMGDGRVSKEQVNWLEYPLIENEYKMLKKVDSRHFPKALAMDGKKIFIEDCGEPMTVLNTPDDWEDQLKEIVSDLKHFGVIHRDIRPDNLMVKNGVIMLIDFGWACEEGDETPAPECLGFPYKPSWGFDDAFSMRKVIKELKYQEEDSCVS